MSKVNDLYIEKTYILKSRESLLNIAGMLNIWKSSTMQNYKVLYNDFSKVIQIVYSTYGNFLKN